MEKENLFVPAKSETFTMTLTDMMGELGDTELGEVKVCASVDGETRVTENFAAPETFLVALRCRSDGCSAEAGEDWLAEKLRAEEMSGDVSTFSLEISEDLVVAEADSGYVFADRDGVEYDYEETVKIIKEMSDYFAG